MGRKILLIEDDRDTADYLTKGLTQEGHSVEQATNGQDGLFRATDGTFDLIELDRMLPLLDGISVLKALRSAQIDTPVLILSALGSVGGMPVIEQVGIVVAVAASFSMNWTSARAAI